ncbi:hypothetical protein [Actinoplanes auranticolor]|uniref:hypothetical protein n=1 Tax=Actinoplanes auranticolor TaxID=47988 RepID=UPI001BB3E60F|nr:hypothetical protein [Actinoplanes auranticolor]
MIAAGPAVTVTSAWKPPCTSTLFFTTALPVTVAPLWTQAGSSMWALPETVLLPGRV